MDPQGSFYGSLENADCLGPLRSLPSADYFRVSWRLQGKVSQTSNMCVAGTYTIFQFRDLTSHALFYCDFRGDVMDYFCRPFGFVIGSATVATFFSDFSIHRLHRCAGRVPKDNWHSTPS